MHLCSLATSWIALSKGGHAIVPIVGIHWESMAAIRSRHWEKATCGDFMLKTQGFSIFHSKELPIDPYPYLLTLSNRWAFLGVIECPDFREFRRCTDFRLINIEIPCSISLFEPKSCLFPRASDSQTRSRQFVRAENPHNIIEVAPQIQITQTTFLFRL
jgi:hypothetical protein